MPAVEKISDQPVPAALVGTEAWGANGPAGKARLTAELMRAFTNAVHPAVLTGAGNYTVPAGCYMLHGFTVGGGAGGGGIATGAAATGTSGQPGCVLEFWMRVTPGQVIPYNCGAGGLGAPAGANDGSNGNDTTFGSVLAKGGVGGKGSAGGNAANPATTAVRQAQIDAMAIVPTADLVVIQWVIPTAQPGASGVGGRAFQSPTWGLSGAAITNSAGGNATGYGGAGAGAGHSTGANLGGGNGSAGATILVS